MPQPDARLVNATDGARAMIGWALRAFVGAMLVGLFAGVTRYDEVWTPVQRLDFSSYVRASMISTIGFTPRDGHNLLFVVDRRGRHLVTDDTAWQVPIGGAPSWVLSAGAKAAGAQRLEWTTTTYAHAALAAFFKDAVYAGQSPFALFAPTLRSTVLTFAGLVFLACVNDLLRTTGRRIRGAELVTPRLFNRRLRADGLTILQQPGRVARRFGWHPRVRLSRRLEAHHTLVMGDIGAGTSAIIRQILRQIAARGERAIVYDPALEFLPECYEPSRGDIILNPLDRRSPYWTPADEVLEPTDALTVATALVSDHPQAGRDAVAEVSRRLVVHLLSTRPSPSDLATWLAHPAELNARLAGTAEARILARLTPEQRTSVLASLQGCPRFARRLRRPGRRLRAVPIGTWRWPDRPTAARAPLAKRTLSQLAPLPPPCRSSKRRSGPTSMSAIGPGEEAAPTSPIPGYRGAQLEPPRPRAVAQNQGRPAYSTSSVIDKLRRVTTRLYQVQDIVVQDRNGMKRASSTLLKRWERTLWTVECRSVQS